MQLTRRVHDRMGPADPAGPDMFVDWTRAEQTLNALLNSDSADRDHLRPPRRRGWHPAGWAVAAAGCLAAGVMVSVNLGTGTPKAVAATPPPLHYVLTTPAQPVPRILRSLAHRVVRRHESAGPVDHLTSRSWSLFAQVGGPKTAQVHTGVVPSWLDEWWRPDGSGRAASGLLTGPARSSDVRIFGPHQRAVMWATPAPADPADLARWLQRAHPVSNGPAEILVSIEDLMREQVLDPAQRAAVLDVLADVPGLSYTGQVTDRAGRHGEAFSVDSAYSGLPTRYTVIVDPLGGRLLDEEQMLTRTAGKLNVVIPAVIDYTTYIAADHDAGGLGK